MLSELDETIRQVLIKEGGFDPGEVDVSFEIPNREWSAGISKPTLNCYLFDIHEKRTLREEGWHLESKEGNGAAKRQPPLYFEMTYLITAWTREVEDEHRLLWHVLRTMVRFPILPAKHLQGALSDYGWPIHTSVAQLEGVLKSPGEFWTALENHLKPSLSYVVLLALDREAIPAGPPVLTTRLRVGPSDGIATNGAPIGLTSVTVDEGDMDVTIDAEGRLRLEGIMRGDNGTPIKNMIIEVEGHNLRTTTDDQGRFRLDGLLPGHYILQIQGGHQIQRCEINVRDPAFKLRLDLGEASISRNRRRHGRDEGGDTTR